MDSVAFSSPRSQLKFRLCLEVLAQYSYRVMRPQLATSSLRAQKSDVVTKILHNTNLRLYVARQPVYCPLKGKHVSSSALGKVSCAGGQRKAEFRVQIYRLFTLIG